MGKSGNGIVKSCGRRRCLLPASVEIIGCCLGHIYNEGRVTGTSIRPFLAAINTVHTRAGFPTPTQDPVIASIRVGYNRATADSVASKPRSGAYPRQLVLLRSRKRYVLGSRRQLPLLRWASSSLSVPCLLKVFSPKTSPRPQLRSTAAYAVRKEMQPNEMTAFSASLSRLLQTPLQYCSHDSLDAARAAYCSRSPLPGSTAPSFALVVRPPFAPLPWVAFLVVL
jgi:hypothetical protein